MQEGRIVAPPSPPLLPSACYSSIFFLSLFLVYFFILRERKRERERAPAWGRGIERETKRIPSRLCTVTTEPDAGLAFTNCKIVTWAEIKSWTLHWWNHPGAPFPFSFGGFRSTSLTNFDQYTLVSSIKDKFSTCILPSISLFLLSPGFVILFILFTTLLCLYFCALLRSGF